MEFHNSYFKGIKSQISICVIIVLSFLQTSNLHAWKWGNGIIYWDTISYYAYLPAIFIHNDLSLEFLKQEENKNNDRFWPETTSEGKFVIKTTGGVAYLYFPFFIAAHMLAEPLGYEKDGFSEIYQIALAFSPLLYLLAGLIFLKKILDRYFDDCIVAITLLATGTTNLFYYSSVTTMSHTYSFSLICAFLYISILWIEKPGMLNSILAGLLLGFISLIRPTNSLIVLFPLLFGITDKNSIRTRVQSLLKNPQLFLVIAGTILIVWLPQMIYWKYQTGHFLYFSYSSEEKFFWRQPEIFRGLFGFRKGWLIYSPVMIFSLAGIVLSFRKLKEWFYPLIFIIPLSIYIMLSWWSWWYGGGFGMRPVIDYYGLLAIPMALSVSRITKSPVPARYSGILLFSIFFSLGCLHHLQAVNGAIHWDSMTWKSYRYNFGHMKMTEEGEKNLVHPDYEKALKERED